MSLHSDATLIIMQQHQPLFCFPSKSLQHHQNNPGKLTPKNTHIMQQTNKQCRGSSTKNMNHATNKCTKQMHQTNRYVPERTHYPHPQMFLFRIHDLPVEARDCREGPGHHWQEKGESCTLMAHSAPG